MPHEVLLAKLLLILSGICVTLAWSIPVFKLKIDACKLGRYTISTIADSKYGGLYKSLLMISSLTLSTYIYLNYQQTGSKLIGLILFLSSIMFINVSLKTNYLAHTASAFVFYFVFSLFCLIYTQKVFRFLPLILFIVLVVQMKILNKGNGISILLFGYASWLALLVD